MSAVAQSNPPWVWQACPGNIQVVQECLHGACTRVVEINNHGRWWQMRIWPFNSLVDHGFRVEPRPVMISRPLQAESLQQLLKTPTSPPGGCRPELYPTWPSHHRTWTAPTSQILPRETASCNDAWLLHRINKFPADNARAPQTSQHRLRGHASPSIPGPWPKASQGVETPWGRRAGPVDLLETSGRG